MSTGSAANLQLGSSASSHSVTSVNGVATFTSLGFPSTAAFGQHRLIFSSSDSYLEVDLDVNQTRANEIVIGESPTSGGSFDSNGVFVPSATSAHINKSTLATQLASTDVLIEARSIQVAGSNAMSATGNRNLTLRNRNGFSILLGSHTSQIGSFLVGGQLIVEATNHINVNGLANADIGGAQGCLLYTSPSPRD